MTASTTSRELVQLAVNAADSKGATDPVAIDVSEQLSFADAFLILTGRNERNVAAIADEIEDQLLQAGTKRLRREGRVDARWVLLDFGDLIVHVFHEQERVYYDLERLWKDGASIEFTVPEPVPADER